VPACARNWDQRAADAAAKKLDRLGRGEARSLGRTAWRGGPGLISADNGVMGNNESIEARSEARLTVELVPATLIDGRRGGDVSDAVIALCALAGTTRRDGPCRP
jgi:hypothetical protein